MLTREILIANAALSGLTDEQIAAITTLSANDENSVIAKKTGEIYGGLDADILAASGIAKNGTEKTFDYAKRVVAEFKTKAESASALQVASFTDAWIETNRFFVSLSNPFMSHLLQMRGLKPGVTYLLITCIGSHLLQMRGLKHG